MSDPDGMIFFREPLGVHEGRVRVTPLAAHEQYRVIEPRAEVEIVLARYDLVGRPYILNMGNLEPCKNLCRPLEAFDCLRRGIPCFEHQLVLVGARGWKDEDIFETIRNLRLEPFVRWLGYVPFEELPALLNGAALFVFPALYEGFGLPPLEAMACGIPGVVSRASSLPEIVGDAGVQVDPYDAAGLAEAMHSVLIDSHRWAELREKGLTRAQVFS